jgi:hypothetical protein
MFGGTNVNVYTIVNEIRNLRTRPVVTVLSLEHLVPPYFGLSKRDDVEEVLSVVECDGWPGE